MQNSQRQIFQQQISLLRCQIEQQEKREQKLKQLVNTLTQQMQYQKQTQQQNFKLTQLNEKLLQSLKQIKGRYNEQAKYYDTQISKLKQQIHEKINQNDRLVVEHKKRQLVYQQKITMLQSQVEKKRQRINDLKKKMDDQYMTKEKQIKQREDNQSIIYIDKFDKPTERTQRSITQLGASTLRVSQLGDYYDSQNNMRASNISTMSRKSKVSDFMKMDKSQMKNMMHAIVKSKKQLQKVHTRNTDNYRNNKTMLN